MSLDEEKIKIFLKVYKDLLEKKSIEDKADYRQVGLSTSQFGRIQAGEIYFPEDSERKLIGIFHVNASFIYNSRGKMLWANDPIRQIGVVNKAVKKDKKKLPGEFRSLENTEGNIDLVMN